MVEQAVILAGGRGTRLAAVLGDLPKPMVPVAGVPLLRRQIDHLAAQGIRDILLLVGHRREAIRAHFGDGAELGVRLVHIADEPPRGTAGALLGALDRLAPRAVVLFGDTLLDVDIARAEAFHVARDAETTLFVHPNDHPHDSDLVETDADDRVRAVHPYPHPDGRDFRNLVNAALYIVERAALAAMARPEAPTDIAKHLVPAMIAAGRRVFAYRSTEYIKDVGTPERLARAERDLAVGKPAACRLSARRPAVFLDRDGTLNRDTGWIARPDDLHLVDGAASLVRRVNRSGALAVVVTNQPVVARGDADEAMLERIHARLETRLGRAGAFLDGLFHCPHHPDRGFAGERVELKIRCACRKPAPGLIEAAAAALPIDLAASVLIGDSAADTGAARAAGITSILVPTDGTRTPAPALAATADFTAASLEEAGRLALEVLPALRADAAPLARRVAAGDWIAIGGPAHSGKSSFARMLRHALRARGIEAEIVALDRWIRSADARDDESVTGRIELDAIGTLARTLAALDRPATIALPRYDRTTRRRLAETDPVTFAPRATIVFEGVAAFLVEDILARAAHRVWREADPELRRARFLADYARRGLEPAAIEALFARREGEEVGLLRTRRPRATTVIREQAHDHHPDAA